MSASSSPTSRRGAPSGRPRACRCSRATTTGWTQAFVETPDGVRIEILEDKTQTMPIRNEHVHFFLPEAEIPKAQAWYAKTFGGKAGTRNNAAVVDLPGPQLRFAKADTAQTPTRGRVLHHIALDVKHHQAF